ncbi:cell filamentation protein [Bifidobacterium margollesii]|uniref:protein adenylyltransferase n=1 Tax=Bifidobacterium margollesii TaxID=2020964 RepID=A0A2N5J9B2_9BIFI|nr:Fic family protein [Bifidobacterium margollesii]PLS30803.1 cell filamentation protein [Bifidobacterium margollesii]
MSAVAFAAKNCALESMMIGDHAIGLAREYESGRIRIDDVVAACSGEGEGLMDTSADMVFVRSILLAERPARPTGDLQELREIHRILFEGVFPRAGQLRERDTASEVQGTSIDDLAGNSQAFFPSSLLETGAANIAAELADERNLKCLDRPDFVRRLAHFYDELGYLHPFGRGNAMTLRIFASRLAHDAGWDLDWGPVQADEYRSAKRLAYRGDTSGFEKLFDRIVRPANPTRIFLIAGWDQGPAH